MKDAGNYSKKIVDDLLDQITSGDHSKTVYQLKQVCSLVPRNVTSSSRPEWPHCWFFIVVWDALFSIVSWSSAGLAVGAAMRWTKLEMELISREEIFFLSPARSFLQHGSLCDCRKEEAEGCSTAEGRRDRQNGAWVALSLASWLTNLLLSYAGMLLLRIRFFLNLNAKYIPCGRINSL